MHGGVVVAADVVQDVEEDAENTVVARHFDQAYDIGKLEEGRVEGAPSGFVMGHLA